MATTKLENKGAIYLVCQKCDDSYYDGRPTRDCFETKELAQEYVDNLNRPFHDDGWDDYYVKEVFLYGELK